LGNRDWSVSRRRFLKATPAAVCGISVLRSEQRIDRPELVRRHNPVVRELDPRAPLSVGNGEFAFTADVTGLQTLPEPYEKSIPLCTQSQWGWHSFPLPGGLAPDQFRLTSYDTYGRPVGYATSSDRQQELYNWLRENPHRLHLGRIGLRLDGRRIRTEEVTTIHQTLDLWTGILHSRFTLNGVPVVVETCCHPQQDLISAAIECRLVEQGRLAVCIEFPYGSPQMTAADWDHPDRHVSSLTKQSSNLLEISRELDQDKYFVSIGWEGRASIRQEAPHRIMLLPGQGRARLSFVCRFTPAAPGESPPGPGRVFVASRDHWRNFWSEGGAVELAGSRDKRARELERRVVLSQYLTAIQCAGSLPPQETGLTCNSWNGKYHLEMHWWHAAHFALWGRVELLERSLGWYKSILSGARRRAADQGYKGARWPKMVGPDGRDSPSPIGPLLIWQQPHPIALAEICHQSHPDHETLERYKEIVFDSADFLASYAVFDPKTNRYVLGPPVIPAQENHPPRETWNPTFELEYWTQGLSIAQRWRQRLGLQPESRWEHVRSHLSALPVREGLYLAHENCPQTFTERNRDHPSMLAALGVLPGSKADADTMRRTLKKVLEVWRWQDTWGWDYPMVAMTAARLAEPALAVDALLMDTPKNTWFPNGHNWQRPNLPLYLPGNGGLLAAIALMAAGWQGGPKVHAPGFPSNTWTVRWEGLNAFL
jgi:hypothetical protein